MKALDRKSSLFCLVVSALACIESYRLGIGSLHKPGMGFTGFWTSALLGVLSLALFLQSSVGRESLQASPHLLGPSWKRIVLVLGTLVAYSKFMPVVGYLIATFLLMVVLFWLVKGERWHRMLLIASLTAVVTYLVFSKWLGSPLPVGWFGF
jgi:hypothetical protein